MNVVVSCRPECNAAFLPLHPSQKPSDCRHEAGGLRRQLQQADQAAMAAQADAKEARLRSLVLAAELQKLR